jgi:hypothetical protein
MSTTNLPLYKVGALALTRAALGAGIGLLAADRLPPEPRKVIATVLLGLGIATTVPLVVSIVKGIDAPSTPADARTT